MIIVDDETTCRILWNNLDLGSLSFGVTGNFDFRKLYSSIFGRKSYFICDNVQKPTYVLPLSKGKGKVDWFGTSELEDPPFYCDQKVGGTFCEALEKIGMPLEIKKVNQLQMIKMNECSLVRSSEFAGVKVVSKAGIPLTGTTHWSNRNIRRMNNSFANLQPKWVFTEKPTLSEINSVFYKSIQMFSSKNRTSKLANSDRQEKYRTLYMSNIPGVKSVIGTCYINKMSAINALFLLCDNTATISTVTLNVEHPENKTISQYGFRYSIFSLKTELENIFGCQIVDYQGGNHSWKNEISPNSQIFQYNVKLNYGNL